jgi:hypothetical protein
MIDVADAGTLKTVVAAFCREVTLAFSAPSPGASSSFNVTANDVWGVCVASAMTAPTGSMACPRALLMT